MRIRPLATITNDAWRTLRRFPFVMVMAGIGTACSLYYTHLDIASATLPIALRDFLTHVIMACALGLPLFLALQTFIARKALSRAASAALIGLGGLAVVGYILWLGRFPTLSIGEMARYSVLLAGAHLLVAVAPFVRERTSDHSFWQYNIQLFARILLAGIFSCTIYAGLAGALAVSEKLFSFNIASQIYVYLWIVTVGIFNTWYFLSGVPDLANFDTETLEYPKALRAFALYVLLPLVTIHGAILYVYAAKILLTWTLPVGWISTLVLTAASVGLLTMLLVYPYRELPEHAWVRGYARIFYPALIPLTALMAIAIGRRIADYGVTEERYLVVMSAVWIFFVATLCTLKPHTHIRTIPLSLLILVLLASAGPWGMLSMSKCNQLARLEQKLAAHGLLVDHHLQKNDVQLSNNERHELYSIAEYVERHFGLDAVKPWLSAEAQTQEINAGHLLGHELGIADTDDYESSHHDGIYFSLGTKVATAWNIAGYRVLIPLDVWNADERSFVTFTTTYGAGTVGYAPDAGMLSVQLAHASALEFPLQHWMQTLQARTDVNHLHDLALADATLDAETPQYRARLIVIELTGNVQASSMSPKHLHAMLLITPK